MTTDPGGYRPAPQPVTIINKNVNTQIMRGRNTGGCGAVIVLAIIATVIGAALHSIIAGLVVTGVLIAGAGYLVYRSQRRKALPSSVPAVRHYHGAILHAHRGGDVPHDHLDQGS